MKTATLITLCALALALPVVAKEGGGERNKGERREHKGREKSEALQAFMKEQQAERKAFEKKNRETFEARRKALMEGEASTGCKELASLTRQSTDERVAFATKQHGEMVDFMKKEATEKEIPEEKQDARAKEMAKRLERTTAHIKERGAQRADLFDKLSNQEGITWPEVREAMQESHPRGKERGRGPRERKGGEGEKERKGKKGRGDTV